MNVPVANSSSVPAAAAPPPPAGPEVASAPDRSAPQGQGRRTGRVLARWAALLLLFGGAGTATASAVMSLDRSDVPGLATESDGRWQYPELTLPPLPSGSPLPFATGNEGYVHHADLRALLLPAPAGATPDEQLDGGWASTGRFVAEYAQDRRPALDQALADSALRHIAARGWTMPDGTKVRIYLLRFTSGAHADRFLEHDLRVTYATSTDLSAAPGNAVDREWSDTGASGGIQHYLFTEETPPAGQHTRHGYLSAGDTLALIIHERNGTSAPLPFHQTVILQGQLLS
ncbi:hypothetical protein ACF1G0_33050 [Streptomyces sp. NPDC013953]|uniref:hypothetical protein n=1 Tax=Streptomyces sp. NPDC013953 TaxID=3364868 RepID=UPI0036FC2C87